MARKAKARRAKLKPENREFLYAVLFVAAVIAAAWVYVIVEARLR